MRTFHLIRAAVCAALLVAPAAAQDKPAAIDEVLAWLPEDTESLAVAQNFTLQGPPRGPDAKLPSLTVALQHVTLMSFAGIGQGAVYERLIDRKVKLSVHAARHFRAPRGSGRMRYAGCQIVLFDKPLDEVVPPDVRSDAKALRIEEQDVLHFTAGSAHSFVAQPRANLLLCANDEAFLRETLARLRTPARNRALPATLAEWRHVERTAAFWAVRHYVAKEAALDPTSPLAPQDAANVPDPNAVGFTATVRVDDNRPAVRYLTGNKDGESIARRAWHRPDDGLFADVGTMKDGAVEIRMKCDSVEDDGKFLFALFAALGHAVIP